MLPESHNTTLTLEALQTSPPIEKPLLRTLGLGRLDNLRMLLLVGLVDISLDHPNHSPVRLDPDILPQHPATSLLHDPPRAPDLHQAQRWVSRDLGVGTFALVGNLQLVCGVSATDGFLVSDAVLGIALGVAFDELRASDC